VTDAASIVNTLKSAWDIIQNGKKAPGLEGSAANAIPAGADPMTDLEAWMGPGSHEFRYYSSNKVLGLETHTISDVTMTLQWSFAGRLSSGRLKGKGMYLNNVRLTIDSDTTIGDTLNIKFQTGTPENRGDATYPIAGLPLYVTVDENPGYTLNRIQQTYQFYLEGTGAFHEY
jgi:hypothetical protein